MKNIKERNKFVEEMLGQKEIDSDERNVKINGESVMLTEQIVLTSIEVMKE